MYHWARVAAQRDPIAGAQYDALRERGHTHGRALRSVADRLLRVLMAMLKSGTLYEIERHPEVAAALREWSDASRARASSASMIAEVG